MKYYIKGFINYQNVFRIKLKGIIDCLINIHIIKPEEFKCFFRSVYAFSFNFYTIKE